MSALPCDGWLHMDGWEGRTVQHVRVIGETPKRYRIEAITETRVPGYYLDPGATHLVPKHAVTFQQPPTDCTSKGQP